MEVQAITRRVRMSPQKMREVVRQIQGLPALQAQAILAVTPRKGARVVAKTLADALANAEHLKREWSQAKLQQEIPDLQGLIENTRNHKRRNKHARKLKKLEGFAASGDFKLEDLRIKRAVANKGAVMRRFQPKARGSAGPILKRQCQVTIVLSDK